MAIDLNPKEAEKLLGILKNLDELRSENSRWGILKAAGLGEIASNIDLSNSSYIASLSIVSYLSDYGRLDDDSEALGLFLNAFKGKISQKHQEYFDYLVAKYEMLPKVTKLNTQNWRHWFDTGYRSAYISAMNDVNDSGLSDCDKEQCIQYLSRCLDRYLSNKMLVKSYSSQTRQETDAMTNRNINTGGGDYNENSQNIMGSNNIVIGQGRTKTAPALELFLVKGRATVARSGATVDVEILKISAEAIDRTNLPLESKLPKPSETVGLILKGRAPTWLYAYLTHKYAHLVAWLAVFDPNQKGAIVVASHSSKVIESDLVKF
ncbi:MAG: hypothetical protein F6J93_40080 [Oscillatoria sp. SIO1A7]|nr:hypothetical protein [Oscillatoria sp. SIO1A7]